MVLRYALAFFILAAFLALIALFFSAPSDRRLTAGIGVVVSASFWTVPLVMLSWIETPFSVILLVIALSTVLIWALLATTVLEEAFS